jgi:hypothetical protein
MHHRPDHIDHEWRTTHLQLLLLSHGGVTNWAPTTSGTRDRDPRPTGDSNPVADQYAAAYADAAGQIGRQRVLNEAREELARWRGHGIKRHEGESQEERDLRMLREGQGFDPQTVAVRFDTNACETIYSRTVQPRRNVERAIRRIDEGDLDRARELLTDAHDDLQRIAAFMNDRRGP